jgi:zinc protease
MRNLIFGALTLMTTTLGFTSSNDAQAAASVEEVVSPGGIHAYLIREPAVPMLAVSFLFDGGAQYESADRAGLARMTAALLDEGAGEMDSQAFRTALEDNAIRLSFDADRDHLVGELRTLTANRELAFDLLRQALTEPRFDAEPIERIRAQIEAGLKRRLNDPGVISRRSWFAHAFGDHAYGHPAEGRIETVAELGRADFVAYTEAQLARDKLHIGVAGDITAEELAPALDRIFGDLPATSPAPDVAEVEPEGGRTVIENQAVPQSVVSFGHGGIDRQDPDYYAAYVANYVLGGGGFQSRLLHEIREKRGLAYGAYSYLLDAEKAPLWLGGVATNNDDVAESIRLVREQVASVAAGEITADELEGAKTFLTGSFPLRLTSNAQVAQLLRSMSAQGLGRDYLDRRNGYIEAVNLEDVNRVAAEVFDPDALLFVVVGQPEGLEG